MLKISWCACYYCFWNLVEYLQRSNYNLIYVDWSDLAPSPCYLSAVHNIKHTGACIAQLVERILDLGTDDIHLIGFSLGAQVTNFVGSNLQSFKLPRITGDYACYYLILSFYC